MTNARTLTLLSCALLTFTAAAQPYGKPDTGAPGDAMIQAYLKNEAVKLDASFADDLLSREAWEAKRPQRYEEYMYMLGLSPRPEKTPLKATVTRTLDKGDYAVDMLHYQSVPGLY